MQKRTDDLKALVKSNYVEISSVPYYNAIGESIYRADLSSLYSDESQQTQSTDEYMLFVKAVAQTCVDDCCDWGNVKLVQQDDISNIAKDPFNKPKVDKTLIFFEDSDIFVWTAPGASVGNFLVTFIKRPVQMNKGTYGGTLAECELSEYTHKEILQMSVKIALENIESPRQQTQEVVNVNKVE